MKRIFLALTILLGTTLSINALSTAKNTITPPKVKVSQLSASLNASKCVVSMELGLSDLKLKGNQQILVTPYIETPDQQHSVQLPTVCISGRNMHYVYLRTGQAISHNKYRYDIKHEVRSMSKEAQTFEYNESVPMQPWMLQKDAMIRVVVDTCGCGRPLGSAAPLADLPLDMNPINQLIIKPYPAPVVEVPVLINHHGVARVEFEVDKFELHQDVYSYVHSQTRRKHVIDNRHELKVIDDSIHYALSNPNVEIQSISICGYASPESPYVHNEYLATNRSKAVADYIANNYNLPSEKCTYNAVPENWAGFRKQVTESTTLSATDRDNLLKLIDRPTYGPTDYDNKETELITSPKFARLYRELIHPDWFPKLRYTDFVIRTQLKPLSVEQLQQVIKTTPELMSLNQMYTVANSYAHGTPEFHKAIMTAVKYFPDSIAANINAAALAIDDKDYESAARYLSKADNSDEAENMRGILAVNTGNYAEAYALFEKVAARLPEARRNMELVKHLKDIKF